MQKLQKGQVLKYPIDLYLSKKNIALMLVLGLLLFPLFFYGVPWVQEKNDWLALVSIWFFIVLIFFGVIVVLLTLIKGKPVLQITDTGITLLQVIRRPQQRYLSWQDIECIGIDCQVIKHHEIWLLVIQPKQGKLIQCPIKPMRYKDAILNEMEVVHLVQLAFEGRSAIHYEPIEMERMKLLTPRMKWLILALILICLAVYLFLLFK